MFAFFCGVAAVFTAAGRLSPTCTSMTASMMRRTKMWPVAATRCDTRACCRASSGSATQLHAEHMYPGVCSHRIVICSNQQRGQSVANHKGHATHSLQPI